MRYAIYNLGPVGEKVDNARAKIEIPAIVNATPEPHVTALVECDHRIMPGIEGQVKIRSTQNHSKANLCLYVNAGVFIGTRRWIMCETEWPRVLHGGMHPARAILIQNLGVEKETVVLSHAPQAINSTMDREERNGLLDARQEWLQKMEEAVRSVSTQRRVLVLTDPNGLQDLLGQALGNNVIVKGTNGEGAISKRYDELTWDFRKSASGVTMLSDHHGYGKGRAS
jgi:hypothetical protein